jgi:hypothetical protein
MSRMLRSMQTSVNYFGSATQVCATKTLRRICRHRRLPGPIGSNNRDNFSAPDLETHLTNNLNATEVFGNVLDPEFNELVKSSSPPFG